jgi:hypothetical protein
MIRDLLEPPKEPKAAGIDIWRRREIRHSEIKEQANTRVRKLNEDDQLGR